jgi:hypothetical protein
MIEVIEKTPFVFEDGKIYYFSVTVRESSNTFHDLWVYEKKTIERKTTKILKRSFWRKPDLSETTDLVDEFVLINERPELIRVSFDTYEIKKEIKDILHSKKSFVKLKDWDGFVGDIPEDLKSSLKREAKLNSILSN